MKTKVSFLECPLKKISKKQTNVPLPTLAYGYQKSLILTSTLVQTRLPDHTTFIIYIDYYYELAKFTSW